jgi:hypothetical protein
MLWFALSITFTSSLAFGISLSGGLFFIQHLNTDKKGMQACLHSILRFFWGACYPALDAPFAF